MVHTPDDNTLVRDLTLGQLRAALFGTNTTGNAKESGPVLAKPKRYIYGVKGIEDYFGVSHKTAQKYKDGILKPAVNQNGRVIVTDADLAMELFNEDQKRKNGK